MFKLEKMKQLAKKLGYTFGIVMVAMGLSGMAHAEDGVPFSNEQVAAMLSKADSYRLQQKASRVITEVQVFKSGELDSQDTYHVYTRSGRQSLVVFKGAGKEGTKMLMLQDNYWMLMPRSRRPIRITPMQKLLGGASVGDVATLTWSEDYEGTYVASEVLDERPVHRLNLTAKTKGVSYQRITLLLDSDNNFPVMAELYLKSGKLAKVAHFTPGEREGKKIVEEMLLMDTINTNMQTRVRYESVSAHDLPGKYYNPAYLSHQSAAGL